MRTVLMTQGLALVILAIFMTFPALVEVIYGSHDYNVFLLTSFICLFLGSILVLTNQVDKYELKVKEVYLLTVLTWTSLSFFGALPFYFTSSVYHLSLTDAIFETVSGLTTTGSTVYVKLDEAPKGILLWRSLLVFLGGAGIVALGMTIFPFLRVGGMQLFQSESSDRSDKVFARVHQVGRAILITYLLLNILCAISFYLGGMDWFDAVNHAMAAIGTGGFSTHDASFGYFQSPKLEWIASFFMMLGGTPLLLIFYILMGKKPNRPLLSQAKAFWVGMGVVIIITTSWVYYSVPNMGFYEVLYKTTFNLTSIVTTTGFASTDYTLWGGFIIVLVYFLTIAGGCTGSTSGGIKIFRFQVMVQMLILYAKRLIYPNGVFQAKIGGKALSEEIMQSVVIFFALFALLFCVITLLLTITGLDIITSLAGAATSLSNVGPGLGDIIGPVGNFGPLNDQAIWVLTFGMVIGRLEIITLLVLCSKYFWQDFSMSSR